MSICHRSNLETAYAPAWPAASRRPRSARLALAAVHDLATELQILFRFAFGLDYVAGDKADAGVFSLRR